MSAALPSIFSDCACIYGLVDPRDPLTVKYIGKTSATTLDRRLKTHIDQRNKIRTPKNQWIKSLINLGLKPKAILIELCCDEEWQERERYWIFLYRNISDLKNVSDGGDSGPSRKGAKLSDRARENVRRGLIGRIVSEETKNKLRAFHKGKQLKPHQLEKLRVALKSKAENGSDWWKKGINAAKETNIGRTVSPETRKKIGDKQRGRRGRAQTEKWTPIICVETGSWFSSISEATNRCGFKARNSINQALKLGSKAGGFHWQYSSRKEQSG